MKKQLATVILALAATAALAETKRIPSPDGVNELIVENGRVIATTTALAMRPEEVEDELAQFDCAVINAQATLNAAKDQSVTNIEAKTAVDGKPFIQKKTRSPLGKEIDSARNFTMKMACLSSQRDNQLFSFITNLAARVEVLEAAESNRLARVEAAKAAAAKRREARESKQDSKQILQNAIRRGKKVEKEVK